MTQIPPDERSVAQLFKEWRKVQEVRRTLIREGLLSGNSTLDDLVAALRSAIPPDIFAVRGAEH